MKTSNKGINLIKEFEGCKLKAYKCPAGVLTIGYGHTGSDVTSNLAITQAKATELLKKDLEKFEKKVAAYDKKYDWNQNEFDALVSFAFNIGNIDQLTAKGTRSKSEIATKILAYNKAGGTVLAGLTRRREAEKKLFLTKVAVAATTKSTVKYRVTANALNCRKSTSMQSKIVGVFKHNTKVEFISKSGAWLKVKGISTNNKTITGYCFGGWLEKII